jgi:hypothetical protein
MLKPAWLSKCWLCLLCKLVAIWLARRKGGMTVSRRWVLLPLATVLSLSGCFFAGLSASPAVPLDLDPETVAGTWRDPRTGALLVLERDGGFTATNLPYEMFSGFTKVLPAGFDPATDKLPAEGIWELMSLRGREGRKNTIMLNTVILAGRENRGSYPLQAERDGSEIVIAFYVGDPDLNNRIVYRRCESGCSASTRAPT